MSDTTTTTRTAAELSPGDVIRFDFRGDHLGVAEVFDVYPLPRRNTNHSPVPLVQLVLLVDDVDRYRQVAATTEFALLTD